MFSYEYEKCTFCDAKTETTRTQDSENLCSECLVNNYFYCVDCEGWHPISELKKVNNKNYCEDCLIDYVREQYNKNK